MFFVFFLRPSSSKYINAIENGEKINKHKTHSILFIKSQPLELPVDLCRGKFSGYINVVHSLPIEKESRVLPFVRLTRSPGSRAPLFCFLHLALAQKSLCFCRSLFHSRTHQHYNRLSSQSWHCDTVKALHIYPGE